MSAEPIDKKKYTKILLSTESHWEEEKEEDEKYEKFVYGCSPIEIIAIGPIVLVKPFRNFYYHFLSHLFFFFVCWPSVEAVFLYLWCFFFVSHFFWGASNQWFSSFVICCEWSASVLLAFFWTFGSMSVCVCVYVCLLRIIFALFSHNMNKGGIVCAWTHWILI